MVYLRVLTATGIEELDKEISNKLALRDIEVVGECYYREGLWGLAKERGADVVVLSPHLPGDGEILEVVKNLRLSGLRVVLLPGRREDETALKLARQSVALGVYDLVWDPVSPAVVVHRIEKPATLAEAEVEPDAGEIGEKITRNKSSEAEKKERKKTPPMILRLPHRPPINFTKIKETFKGSAKNTFKKEQNQEPHFAGTEQYGIMASTHEAALKTGPPARDKKKSRKTGERRVNPRLWRLRVNAPKQCINPVNWAVFTKTISLLVSVIAVAVAVSVVIWGMDQAARLTGANAPVLHESAKAVEDMWKAVLGRGWQ